MRHAFAIAAFGVLACSDSTPPVDPGPTNVTVVSASATFVPNNYDEITIHLKNSGGDGTYFLRFVSPPLNDPNGANRTLDGDHVQVLRSYDETITVRVTSMSQVQAVKVFSRTVNTAAFAVSDCETLRNASTTYCQ
jgi:hypothetical protein